MPKSNALVTTAQRKVEFYDDVLTAVRGEDGRVYVSLPSMCEALGIQTSAQTKRVKRHEVLADGYHVTVMTYTSKMDEQPSQKRQVGVLRVDLVPLWLTGLSVKSVKPEIQPKIKQYQREAAAVLWEAFQEGRLTTEPTFEDLLEQDTDAVQAYKMATAIVKLAKQQILLEGRVGESELRLENVEERITSLEEQLTGSDVITEAQASQLSQAVKAVAIALGKNTGRNEFGACYGEIYRKFNIASYRKLPRSKFDEAMSFLTEWHQSVVGDNPF